MEGSTERGGDTPRGCRPQGVSPTREVDPDTRGGSQHARWIPTREVDPDTQGGSRQGRSDLPPREVVNHLHQELRPQVFTLLYVSFCANKWLRPADCVVTRSVTKLGGLGACPHSRKRPHRGKMNTKIGIHACDPGRDFCIYPSASDQQRDFCSG